MDICLLWVLSGRGLCDELITLPDESYRLWCVVVCDLEPSWMRRPWPTGGCCSKNQQTRTFHIMFYSFFMITLQLSFNGLVEQTVNKYSLVHPNIEYVSHRPVESCICESVTSYLGGGGWRCSFMPSWPRQKMEVSGQLHEPAALPPENDPPPSTGIY
jgi:hypothetical protein